MINRDAGFTVPELLLSVSILAVIISSLSTALLVFFVNGEEALERDDHSGGAVILSSYLDRDIASADVVATGGTACSANTNLLSLSWQEVSASQSAPLPVASGPVYRAAYSVTADAEYAGTYKLQRSYCEGASLVETTTLVRDLASLSQAATASVVSDASCGSGQALHLELTAYRDDTTEPYTFRACTRTRLS